MFYKHCLNTPRAMNIFCRYCKVGHNVNRFSVLSFRQFSYSVTCNSPSNNSQVLPTLDAKERPNENQISLLNHKKHLEKKQRLKIKRLPIIKNLFNGEFDQDILAFPEIHDNKEIEAINKMADSVRSYVSANVDSEQVDRSACLPRAVLDNLKRMGLFGSRLPKEYGGLDFTATEHIRMMEACSLDSSLSSILNTHQSVALQGLLHSGSQNLSSKYLSKLATGEMMATVCVSEEQNENDPSCINTVAFKEKGHYFLNGKKSWVMNGADADLFLVLTKLTDPEIPGISKEYFGVFIVEKDYPGIRILENDDKLGHRGINSCSVEFHQTPVPEENLICSKSNGHEVLLNVSIMNRFNIGAFTSGLAKALVELVTDYSINTNLYKKPLKDWRSCQSVLGKIASKTYAMESMTYLTAGLFDSTENPDLNLEYCAIKVFCTENLWYCVNETLSLMGPRASLLGHPVERAFRDACMWLLLEGPNDLIRQYISAASLDYLKENLADSVQKQRNPLFNPIYALRKNWEDYLFEKGSPPLKMDLQGYLHPSLQLPANNLERSVVMLKHALEVLLRHDGKDVFSNSVSLCRLADMAIDIYAMTAVCSRASRSYCIGLPSAQTEVTLAIAYCEDTYVKVKKLHEDIYFGPSASTDLDNESISREIFRKQGYPFTPPYTRNY